MLCDLSASGLELPVKIGESAGVMRLPRIPAESEGWDLVGWQVPFASGGHFEGQYAPPAEWAWGRTLGPLSGPPVGMAVDFVLFQLDTSWPGPADNSEERTRFFSLAEAWVEILRLWVGALSEEFTGDGERLERGWISGARLHLWHQSGRAATTLNPTINLIVNPSGTTWLLDASDLRHAVDKANSGTGPPYELVLLHEARNSLMSRRLRMSVLDSAAAIELVLHRHLSSELSGVRAALSKSILKRATLGRLVELAEVSVSGVNVQTEVVGVRNRVAHRGEVPDLKEAMLVFSTAESIVKQYATPLSS